MTVSSTKPGNFQVALVNASLLVLRQLDVRFEHVPIAAAHSVLLSVVRRR